MNSKKLIILFTVVFIYSGLVNIQKATANEIDLIVIPDEVFLFKIDNMKPGDWTEKTLTIKNGGTEDISYTFQVNSKQPDKKLFNELDLMVYTDSSSNLLFDDKLKNFNGFSPKLLKKGERKDLMFSIMIPYELGNEYQNTSALFEIIISAESNLAPQPSEDTDSTTPIIDRSESDKSTFPSKPLSSKGLNLPNTATDMYKLLFLGISFITAGLLLIFLNRFIRKKKETY
ncbi:TasA family protein [Rossellomorea sp. GCM10028870]|uniref:TasA family protein n=1 Tax=Rossellomorea sp. GCM10028870 TaxID=3273426 RepID=UPI00361C89B8